MHWIAPTEKDDPAQSLEKKLWHAADQFHADSGLKALEYFAPVFFLIFLRFAEVRFAARRAKLKAPSLLGWERAGVKGEMPAPRVSRHGSRVDEPAAFYAEGILYLPAEPRFDYLLSYYSETHDATGRFDFVLDNWPFNKTLLGFQR